MQRGRNQMLVIQGIVNKAASPAILKSYQDVLAAASDSIATNMPKEDIISKVWGLESEAEDNNVEVYISFLRKKLDHLHSQVKIRTIA